MYRYSTFQVLPHGHYLGQIRQEIENNDVKSNIITKEHFEYLFSSKLINIKKFKTKKCHLQIIPNLVSSD